MSAAALPLPHEPHSASLQRSLLALPAVLALLAAPGCVTLSPTARSHALDEGELRLGTTFGLSRALGADVIYAEPQNEDPEGYYPPVSPALLLEAFGFYGLGEGVDAGLRLRLPLSPDGYQAGAKLESMVQLLSQRLRNDPFSLAVAVGIDGFYRPFRVPNPSTTEVRTLPDPDYDDEYYETTALLRDGGFNLGYHGVQADLTLIAAYRTRPVVEWFGGVRGGYLWLDAIQRYEPEDPGFATVEIEKQVRQPAFGWVGGVTFEPPMGARASFLIVPQFYGYWLEVPGRGWEHQLGSALELGFRF